ncbi:siderophore ABC transporter substrate-binding protein [Marinibacterium sp. SX1]|uniref:siderophore ABC transporter substrate-binding protein n=1 Tax=Marinibacterium sp. SX1 TaxID=3388424 RepID=UPI003D16B886
MAILALGATLSGAAALAQETTVDTARGPVAVPQSPAPLAVFDIAAVDTLDALGVTIDGMPQPNYLGYLDDVAGAAAPVGTLFEPDMEALARMAPELVIIGGRSSTQLEALSKLAPTIDMTIWGDGHVDQVHARLAAYGEIFERQAEASALADALDDKIATATAAAEGKGDALILLTNGGKLSAYGADSRFGWVHGALNLPEAKPGLSTDTHGQAVSFEFLAEVDPDWILVIDRGAAIGQAGEAAAATLDNKLVAGTKAAQNGHIVYLDAGPIYIAGGGVQSMMGTLDELIAAFSDSDS